MSERVFCAGGCGNEGPFEAGDTCSGCIAEAKAREEMVAARRLVAEAAAKLAEAAGRLEGNVLAQDMIVRVRQECLAAADHLEPVDQHQLSVQTALATEGADGLPIVGLATRTGLAVDVLTSTVRAMMDANQVEEFTHAHNRQGEVVDPTTRYRLRV